MRRRQVVADGVPTELPQELAMGPCIEVWAADHELPDDDVIPRQLRVWMRAMRAWESAVDDWALAMGWPTETEPLSNARDLARTRRPWSREFLIDKGRGEWADYYEHGGRRPPSSTGSA